MTRRSRSIDCVRGAPPSPCRGLRRGNPAFALRLPAFALAGLRRGETAWQAGTRSCVLHIARRPLWSAVARSPASGRDTALTAAGCPRTRSQSGVGVPPPRDSAAALHRRCASVRHNGGGCGGAPPPASRAANGGTASVRAHGTCVFGRSPVRGTCHCADLGAPRQAGVRESGTLGAALQGRFASAARVDGKRRTGETPQSREFPEGGMRGGSPFPKGCPSGRPGARM